MGSLLASVNGENVPLTVGYHKVVVEIRDQIARTTVEESFVNSTDAALEGVFSFPLPADASISGFGMWIGDELVEADLVEKQRARAIYEDILRRKKDPGLLEWAGGNVFQARVFPIEPERHVSHETIYTAIYAQPRGELRRQLVACLRHGHSTRMPRTRGTDRRGQIPDMVSIHVRPPEVNDRVMPGHWEGDFIKGAGNKSSVGVLVERTSRLVLLARMEDATASSALTGFTVKLNSVAAPMRQSLTYDQGKEMSRHAALAANTGVRVYFCDPHSPWQRGTCENTNGLLRQYLPKGTDLSIYTQDELDAIDWQTPLQVFAQTLASSHRPPISVQ